MMLETLPRSDMKKARQIQDLLDCQAACEKTISHCMGMGGRHTEPGRLELLRDCAQICAVAADFLARDSGRVPGIAALCEEICLECAHACNRFPDELAMQECATACQLCADACGRLAKTR